MLVTNCEWKHSFLLVNISTVTFGGMCNESVTSSNFYASNDLTNYFSGTARNVERPHCLFLKETLYLVRINHDTSWHFPIIKRVSENGTVLTTSQGQNRDQQAASHVPRRSKGAIWWVMQTGSRKYTGGDPIKNRCVIFEYGSSSWNSALPSSPLFINPGVRLGINAMFDFIRFNHSTPGHSHFNNWFCRRGWHWRFCRFLHWKESPRITVSQRHGQIARSSWENRN